MKLEELKDHVDKLHQLLEDPQPGLASWNEFLGQHFKAIHDAWGKPMMTKDPPTKPGWYFAIYLDRREIVPVRLDRLAEPSLVYMHGIAWCPVGDFSWWSKDPISFPELPAAGRP